MRFRPSFFTHRLAAVAVALTTLAVPPPSQADIGGNSAATGENARQQQMRGHAQTRLDEMARRLRIDASQQDAWNAYTKAVQSTFGPSDAKMERPATNADAATLLRFRASMAERHAKKLTQLADATTKLQEVLNPEQRQTLNEVVRQEGRSLNKHHKHHRGDQPRTP